MTIIIRILRNEVIENSYTGSYVITDPLGNIIEAEGNFNQTVFMRSTIKPIVLLLFLRERVHEHYDLTARESAVIAGSHMGEDNHLEAVLAILRKANIAVSALKCGIHNPFSLAATERLIRKGVPLSVLHHNCSGYHAGLLLLSDYFQVDLDTYNRPGSEVQKRILNFLLSLTSISEAEINKGTDDCHVPTYGMPLHKIAEIYACLAALKYSDPFVALLWNVITSHPNMLAGIETLETDLLLYGKDVLPKIGSGGLYCLALPQRQVGIAIKVDSDDYRVAEAMAVQILMKHGVVNSTDRDIVDRYYHRYQRGLEGEIVTRFEIENSLPSVVNL